MDPVTVEKSMPAGEDLYVPGPVALDRKKKRKKKKRLDPDSFTRTHVLKARGPVDGDGDGWVYDGTPKKRPATPAEMAAGARLRAKKQAGGAGPAKKAAAKRAAPKNDYEKRVAKFERAIEQAVKSGDPKKVKQVHDLIGQDLILKKPDRDRLQKVLAARRDGKPGPAAPAKKAAAPKAAAKAPAKKPIVVDPPKKPMVADKSKTPEPIAERRRAIKQAAKKPGAIQQAAAKTPEFDLKRRIDAHTGAARVPKPSPQNGLKQRIAMSALKKFKDDDLQTNDDLNRLADAIIAARNAGASDEDLQPFRDLLGAGLKRVQEQERGRQKSFERRAAKKVAAPNPSAPKRQPTIQPGSPDSWETTHGPKTRAWMRHAEKDIANARDFRTLKGRMTQVNNLLGDKRISQREANLLKTLIRQRLKALGLDENGNRRPPTWRDKVRSFGSRNAPKKETSFGDLPSGPQDGAETKAYEALGDAKDESAVDAIVRQAVQAVREGKLTPEKLGEIRQEAFRVKRRLQDNQQVALAPKARKVMEAIANAKDVGDLDRVKESLNGRGADAAEKKALRDFFRADPERLKNLNDAMAAKRAELANKTIEPKLPPGEIRARAKANLPPEWSERLRNANDVSDLEAMMDDLEKVPDIPDEDFNKIAAAVNDAMQREEDRENAFAAAAVDFEDHLDEDLRARLDKHFAKKTGTISNAPAEGLYHYLLINPDRFDVKRQEDNKGVSGIDVITDKVTGDRWFAKHSAFKNDYGKEMLAGNILNMLGLSKHKVRISKVGAYDRQGGDMRYGADHVLLTQDALQGNGLDGELKMAARMRHNDIAKADVAKGLQEGDPQGLIDMAIFDFFIDNTADRHANNAFFQRKGTRLKVQFIDHGLAFRAMEKNLAYRTWFASQYRGHRRGGWDISKLIGESVKGRDDLSARVRKSVQNFAKIDFVALRRQYEDNANGDKVALEKIDQMFEMLEERLAALVRDPDQIANVLIDAGGVL